jgi:hypothetical protein
MLSSKTVESTLQDVASHPGHVADQQLEAMTPLVDGAAGSGAGGAGAGAKDLEGVPDTVDAPVETLPGTNAAGGASTSASGLRKRQKKIAVLTSGGDSAGMNAAGEHLRFFLTPCATRSKFLELGDWGTLETLLWR